MDIAELTDHWQVAIPSEDEIAYEEINAMESIFLDENERETLNKAVWMLSYDNQAFGKDYLGLLKEDMGDINFIGDKDKKDILTAYNYSLTFRSMLNNLCYLSLIDYEKTKPVQISKFALTIAVGLRRAVARSSNGPAEIFRVPIKADPEKGIRNGELKIWRDAAGNKVWVEFVFTDYKRNIPFYDLYYKYMGNTEWHPVPIALDKVLADSYDPDPEFCQQIISSSDEHVELDPAKGIDHIAIALRPKDR
jgi:hypothetical protein